MREQFRQERGAAILSWLRRYKLLTHKFQLATKATFHLLLQAHHNLPIWGYYWPQSCSTDKHLIIFNRFFFFFLTNPLKKRISYFIFKDRFRVSHFPRHLTHVIQKCWAVLRGTNEDWYRPHKETWLCSLTSHSVLIKNKLPFPLTPSAAFQHPSVSSKILDILYLHLIKHLRA